MQGMEDFADQPLRFTMRITAVKQKASWMKYLDRDKRKKGWRGEPQIATSVKPNKEGFAVWRTMAERRKPVKDEAHVTRLLLGESIGEMHTFVCETDEPELFFIGSLAKEGKGDNYHVRF
jgi:hypothetical protein